MASAGRTSSRCAVSGGRRRGVGPARRLCIGPARGRAGRAAGSDHGRDPRRGQRTERRHQRGDHRTACGSTATTPRTTAPAAPRQPPGRLCDDQAQVAGQRDGMRRRHWHRVPAHVERHRADHAHPSTSGEPHPCRIKQYPGRMGRNRRTGSDPDVSTGGRWSAPGPLVDVEPPEVVVGPPAANGHHERRGGRRGRGQPDDLGDDPPERVVEQDAGHERQGAEQRDRQQHGETTRRRHSVLTSASLATRTAVGRPLSRVCESSRAWRQGGAWRY